jgi:N6-adenosine-specific RNA methylase IME4
MKFHCTVADPPWKYGDRLRMSNVKRGAEDVYRVMTTDEICALAGISRAGVHLCGQFFEFADDALLWLWVTDPFLLNGDGPRICRAWGFEPKQLWTWITGEVRDDAITGPLGMGHYLRVDTERVILAARGRAAQLVERHDLRNYTVVAPKNKHSYKPNEFYALVEALSRGPRLELFARAARPGWVVAGDELPDTIAAGGMV